MKFKKGDTIIYPQHGACIVHGTKKMEAFGEKREYLILQTVINEMTLKVPVDKAEEVGVRPPVSADELEDLVAVLSKPDPRVPSNWSRRFKNHQEKLKSGDVYQVAEVVRNLAARNRDASLSAAERTMYERARVNLVSEISPALKVSAEEAEAYLDDCPRQGRAQAGQAGGGQEDRRQVAGKPQPVAAGSATAVASVSTMRSTWSSVITNGGQNEFVSVPMARVTTPAASIRSRTTTASWCGCSAAAHTAPSPRTPAIAPSAASARRPSPRRRPIGSARASNPSASMMSRLASAAGARRGMAGVRVAGAQQEAGVRLERLAHAPADEDATQRLVSRGHRLGERRRGRARRRSGRRRTTPRGGRTR